MRLFDPHIHMTSRTTDDYEAMYQAGIRAIVEPAFWLGEPRTHVESFEDYFLSLVGWERFRSNQFGIMHFCTMGLNPKEANNRRLADGVMALLPRYLEKDGVVAVGEIGYDDVTEAEDKYMKAQIELAIAHELPVLIHTPHRNKKSGTERTLAVVKESGLPPERFIIDHNNEETIQATLDSGCFAGHSIYPGTKMDEGRMVAIIQRFGSERIIVNSAADWGKSDPLKVPKTAQAMLAAGLDESTVKKICWDNPRDFFAQSGRLDLDAIEIDLPIDQTQLHSENSVLRGQEPVKRS